MSDIDASEFKERCPQCIKNLEEYSKHGVLRYGLINVNQLPMIKPKVWHVSGKGQHSLDCFYYKCPICDHSWRHTKPRYLVSHIGEHHK